MALKQLLTRTFLHALSFTHLLTQVQNPEVAPKPELKNISVQKLFIDPAKVFRDLDQHAVQVCGGVVWCGVGLCGVIFCGGVWCGVVWCGMVLCGVMWCGVVWCGVVLCCVVGCGVVLCGVVWCDGLWYGVVWRVIWWCFMSRAELL